MNHHQYTTSVERDNLVFFYDTRSQNLAEIQSFLDSERVSYIQRVIHERTYVVLGWDGLFVAVAKEAHRDDVTILGINFGTKGFLLHDRDVFTEDTLEFESIEYPILHVDVELDGSHIHGHAFNEVYITRAGDGGAISLSISHRSAHITQYRGDGIMISTPAGSTGWSRTYGGIILPHDANLNVLTPIGGYAPSNLRSVVIPDKWRIRIANDTKRDIPMDILVDNRRIISMESRPMHITIERANRGVRLLIEKSYKNRWDNKSRQEAGFSLS